MFRTTALPFFAFTILGLSSFSVLGCSCDYSPNPPCRAYWNAPTIFDGVVETFEDLGPNRRRATFKVNNSYKGIKAPELVINTGDGGSDCGYQFEVGKRYLVYAYGDSDFLGTSYCTRTRSFAQATEDLDYFKLLPTLSNGGVIFGSVEKFALNYGNDGDFGLRKPLSNIPIILKGPRSVTLKTDQKGKFQVKNFPAGEYLIELHLPRHLDMSPNTRTQAIDFFRLENKGCVGAEYYVNFEGRISGKVLDNHGRAVAGMDVQLVSADYIYSGLKDTGPMLEWTVSRSDGSFTIDGIPTGRYRLGIGIAGSFDAFGKNGQVFYPNTKDSSKSIVLSVVEGKLIRNLIIRAPQKN